MKRVRRRAALVVALVGLGLVTQGLYIPAKAWLAQQLLEHAWEQRVRSGGPVRPWPWADLAPLARLRQPRLGIAQIVLDDASARTLAFGPGHVRGSAAPGTHGNVAISAHRDTHFRWLADLRDGDSVLLETDRGTLHRYVVVRHAVHHESEVALLDPLGGDRLQLLTCYPFDALVPGTPWRYVVTAVPFGPEVGTGATGDRVPRAAS